MPEPTETSPYKPCFESIEALAAGQEQLAPGEAYEFYDDFLMRNGLDPTIYLSMAITSGGHKRNPALSIGEVISLNSEFGSLAAEALIKQFPILDKGDIVVPAELGKVKGWSQSDYLLFWAHTILGATPDVAQTIEERVLDTGTTQLEGFQNPELSDEQRWRDYESFTLAYARALRTIVQETPNARQELSPNNMQAALFILDEALSLGARAEGLFCRHLGIPPQFQLLDAWAIEAASQGFKEQIAELHTLGAVALGTDINLNPHRTWVGISRDSFETDIAFNAGLRKTGLENALSAKEWYTEHPGAQPTRHQGHRPVAFPA